MIWCVKTYIIAYVKTQKIRYMRYGGMHNVGTCTCNFHDQNDLKTYFLESVVSPNHGIGVIFEPVEQQTIDTK